MEMIDGSRTVGEDASVIFGYMESAILQDLGVDLSLSMDRDIPVDQDFSMDQGLDFETSDLGSQTLRDPFHGESGLDCVSAFLDANTKQALPDSIAVKKGDKTCPYCRKTFVGGAPA